jgi:hypothetical protein
MCMFYRSLFVFSEVRVTRSLVLCVCFIDRCVHVQIHQIMYLRFCILEAEFEKLYSLSLLSVMNNNTNVISITNLPIHMTSKSAPIVKLLTTL